MKEDKGKTKERQRQQKAPRRQSKAEQSDAA